MLVLSYLWILAVIPLVMEKEDREVQWHAKHGLVLTVAEIILWVAITIVQMILAQIVGPLSCVVSMLGLLLWVGILILHIVCIVKAINGQRLIVPGISQYADRF
jgi:uncharacterized membrane protein